jgi:hypothetical protein
MRERQMGDTMRLFTTRGKLGAGVCLLFLASLLLTGCMEGPAIAAVEPTATLYPPPPTDIPPPPPGPTPEALDFPLPPPTPAISDLPDDQSCITCHTDEETLKALATEEEAAESLSEGEG